MRYLALLGRVDWRLLSSPLRTLHFEKLLQRPIGRVLLVLPSESTGVVIQEFKSKRSVCKRHNQLKSN
jgi:hypothetical protein